MPSTLFPFPNSHRSGRYFVARRECFLSSACLRLTSRPKTCSVLSFSRSVLDDVGWRASSTGLLSFVNLSRNCPWIGRWMFRVSSNKKIWRFCIILIIFHKLLNRIKKYFLWDLALIIKFLFIYRVLLHLSKEKSRLLENKNLEIFYRNIVT